MRALFRDYRSAYYAEDLYFWLLEDNVLRKSSLHKLVCKDGSVVKIKRGTSFRERAACWIEDNILSPFRQFNFSKKSR